MTDTNVASTEDGEMSKVREIFERALNAIVAATQLSKEVEQLRGDVSTLRGEIDSVRAYNQRLDVELTATREQRDQALRDKQAAIDELNRLSVEHEREKQEHDATTNSLGVLRSTHESLKHDHDSVQLHNMELEEELKQVKAAHEKIKAALGIQPRDVTSGKWQSPGDVQEPAPEQADTQRTGTGDYWR